MDTKLVVGDRFRDFASLVDGLTLSEVLRKLKAGEPIPNLQIGQGIEPADLSEIEELAEKQEDNAPSLYCMPRERLGRESTHKREVRNQLLTDLTRETDWQYWARLSVAEQHETLSDHLTGYHLPGMCLTEASRQMATATTNNFFLPREGMESGYLILETLTSEFFDFAFPIPTRLKLDIDTCKSTRKSRLDFTVRCHFIQNEALIATMHGTYYVLPHRIVLPREKKKARQTRAITQSDGVDDGAPLSSSA